MAPRRRLNRFPFEVPDEAALREYYIDVPSDSAASGIHGLPYLNSLSLFGRTAPLFLDLGTGRGENVIREAMKHPENVYVGIDVNEKCLHDACAKAAMHQLRNVRFLDVDLRWALSLFSPESVAGAWFLFPPPVLKAKWAKRDIVRDATLDALLDILEPDATLTLATDIAEAFDRWRSLILSKTEFDEVIPEALSGPTWYQSIWESHGLATLVVSVQKHGAYTRTQQFSTPFRVFDPISDHPAWKPPLLRCLSGFASLPVTSDLTEAGLSHTVLIISTHLNKYTRDQLVRVERKIVFVSGLYVQPFCGPFASHQEFVTQERETLEWADIILVPSSYASDLIRERYGVAVAKRVIVVGMPADIDGFAELRSNPRCPKQILLGQRQDVDKHYLLEADVCRHLAQDGYTFVRAATHSRPDLRDFAEYAEHEFGVPATVDADAYASLCATSEYVLITSPSETLCLTAIEATAAGCIPVVPNHTAFREWCHPDNRYDPYSISDIKRILATKPLRPHLLEGYSPPMFMRRLRHEVIEFKFRPSRNSSDVERSTNALSEAD